MKNPLPKFSPGDKVVFLGSQDSQYGYNSRSDKFIGELVTIGGMHHTARPYAYTFNEMRNGYWFEENCFGIAVLDLPDFEADAELDMLLL
jgi:hypothetical protein